MEHKESDQVLEEARKIIARLQYRSVTIAEYVTESQGLYGSRISRDHQHRKMLLEAVDDFLDAQSKNDLKSMSERALTIVKYYTKLSAFGCVKDSDSYEHWYNNAREEADSLKTQLNKAEEAQASKVAEMQKTIDGLYEQVGIAKGMYQECAKRIEQMIEKAGMKP